MQTSLDMKLLVSLPLIAAVTAVTIAQGDPLITSWHTKDAGKYARIWTTIENEMAEKATSGSTVTSVTTWDRSELPGNNIGAANGDQTEPVYGGVQGIAYTDTDVYISSTGLGTHTMGPWYDDIYVRDTLFASFPGNAAILYRFPFSTNYGPGYVSTSEATTPGTCGLFVNGVPLFNTTDTFSYENASGVDGGPGSTASGFGDGVWNRDAFINEGPTFDSGNSHQAMESHHYHANPPALRHLLGDSVDFDPTVVFTGLVSKGGTNPYTENFNGQHSPIIGWVNDGLPMYGPYGYGVPDDATSTVRRMVSGYQKRDGSNGSYDIATNGRNLLPQWTVTLGTSNSTAVASNQTGPNVDDEFTLGRYMEDNAFKGDLISDASGVAFEQYHDAATQGQFDEARHYDLNLYNVRYCVTPEFPEGTWAYFTAIEANGDPTYPYNLAPAYFGDSSMAAGVTEIPAGATVHFAGAGSLAPEVQSVTTNSDDNEITITWSGVEGGIYRVETSSDLETWDETGTPVTTDSTEMTTSDSTATLQRKFYRLTQTGLSPYDDTEFSTATGSGGPGGDGPPGGGPPQ